MYFSAMCYALHQGFSAVLSCVARESFVFVGDLDSPAYRFPPVMLPALGQIRTSMRIVCNIAILARRNTLCKAASHSLPLFYATSGHWSAG